MVELQLEVEKAQKAEQRLRVDRDEWKLMAENMQPKEEEDGGGDDEGDEAEEDHDAGEGQTPDPPPHPDGGDDGGRPPRERGKDPDPPDGDDQDGGEDPEVTEVKISRREADKVVVPSFPTVTHLDNWMSQCIANVLSAFADPNQEEWMKWLSPTFRPHPHKKFKSIDVKLGVAMTAMLRAGSDKAAELYLEVNRKANDYVRSYEGKIIKGRQIIAMMYESFRARDRLDMIVSLLPQLIRVDFPMPPCPVLPPVFPLEHCQSAWQSALSRPDIVDELLAAELAAGWIEEVPGGDEELRSRFVKTAVGKLGVVISDHRPPRLVVDSSISGVTTVAEAKAARCNDTFTGSYEQYLERDVHILADYIAKKQNCSNFTTLTDSKMSHCTVLRNSLTEKQLACSKIVVVTTTPATPTTTQQDNTAEEQALCENYHKKVEACSDYDSCYESVDLAKQSERQAASTLEASRAAEWVALKRMLCLVDVLGTADQNAKIQACMAKAVSDYNTSHLELTLPNAPDKQTCGPFEKPATCSVIEPVFPFTLSGFGNMRIAR
eukprot:s2644_g3.t1